MSALSKAWNCLMKLVERLLVLLLGVISAVLLAQVVSRYVFNRPLIWSEEFSLFLLTWVCFLGASYGVEHRMHIRMTTFVKLLPKTAQKWVSIAMNGVCAAVFAWIMPAAVTYFVRQSAVRSPGMRLPYGFVVICLPVGFALVILSLLVDCVRIWRGSLPTE